jgi:hypothetical protein
MACADAWPVGMPPPTPNQGTAMRQTIPLLLALLLAAGAAGARDGKLDARVTVVNQSAWTIHELYLSSTDDGEWGPDQLGPTVAIASGERHTLERIPCDTYDVKLVDDDGDECVVAGVALCGASATWVVTDEDLRACQIATE